MEVRDPFRVGKAYTLAEAARLASTSSSTVRRWLLGYQHGPRTMEPVFPDLAPTDGAAPSLSFLQLAEVVVAVRFTRFGGRLQKVRDARTYALERWPDLPYPFASLRLKQLGGELLHEFDETTRGRALAISASSAAGEQWLLPGMVQEAIELFDFDAQDELAIRWFPAGRDVPVMVDPHYAGGRLAVVGRAVTVDTVQRRFFDAGQEIAFIARDLELAPHDVEAIVRLAPRAA